MSYTPSPPIATKKWDLCFGEVVLPRPLTYLSRDFNGFLFLAPVLCFSASFSAFPGFNQALYVIPRSPLS